ncbi:MAG TPA: rod shape-determining protein, partial [Firmicutes bacterium]|nr:rod shape-determining protein [Bacillota bacterium]
IIAQEASVVAVNEITREVVAVGNQARQMVGRTPYGLTTMMPMSHGVIARFDLATHLIRYLIGKARNALIPIRPRVVMGIPCDTTEVERRALSLAALRGGARKVFLVEEPIAAGLGVGLPVLSPAGHMVIDVGGGTTNCAIMALGGIVASQTLRVGGIDMDEMIARHLRREYGLMIGERAAEELKVQVGSSYPVGDAESCQVTGRDCVTGMPKSVTVSGREVRMALQELLRAISAAARATIEKAPPELISDISQHGIVATGGGALLRGFAMFLTSELGMPVVVAEEPLLSVVLGLGKTLEEPGLLDRVAVSEAP